MGVKLEALRGLQGGLDVRDAAANSFLTEVASVLTDLRQTCGQDFISFVQQNIMPTIKLPTAIQVLPFHAGMP